MTPELLIEIEQARAQGTRPRVHGNGFIQLDLTERRRLHVWGDPRIPRQSVPSTIHDHTFSFSSRVYVGQLVHRCIDIEHNYDGAYQLYRAVTNRGEDTRLVNSESRYDALIVREHLLRTGDTYQFQAREFHETVAPWLCVTVIDKDGPTLSQGGANPNVLVPFGFEPDNTFDRYQASPDLLWQIIAEATEQSHD